MLAIQIGPLLAALVSRAAKVLPVFEPGQVFYDKAWHITERQTPKVELLELIEHLSPERLAVLLRLAKGLAEGKAMIMM
jgi:hypothetical protein